LNNAIEPLVNTFKNLKHLTLHILRPRTLTRPEAWSFGTHLILAPLSKLLRLNGLEVLNIQLIKLIYGTSEPIDELGACDAIISDRLLFGVCALCARRSSLRRADHSYSVRLLANRPQQHVDPPPMKFLWDHETLPTDERGEPLDHCDKCKGRYSKEDL
jgi:hypothetical protein